MSVMLLAAPAGLFAETVRQAATDGMVLNLGNQPQQVASGHQCFLCLYQVWIRLADVLASCQKKQQADEK